ncbi:hypothetical protein [Gordonia sp. 'Campus']|uniref:hypothetical protein n=1 Tax=Gordonia sp. 'Campus' TaxID=2915824 RepID=UPI001EE3F1D3|nr:hypothetical protein [Gordonia sp. 'Campus']
MAGEDALPGLRRRCEPRRVVRLLRGELAGVYEVARDVPDDEVVPVRDCEATCVFTAAAVLIVR